MRVKILWQFCLRAKERLLCQARDYFITEIFLGSFDMVVILAQEADERGRDRRQRAAGSARFVCLHQQACVNEKTCNCVRVLRGCIRLYCCGVHVVCLYSSSFIPVSKLSPRVLGRSTSPRTKKKMGGRSTSVPAQARQQLLDNNVLGIYFLIFSRSVGASLPF